MTAKVSARGLRFFAHDRTSPGCPSAGETPAHRDLKRILAEAARAAGWQAIVEAEPSAGDSGGWRADVLAVSPSGRRVAFEAQLATMTAEVGRERTERYRVDSVECLWVTTKHAPWLYAVPGVRVELSEEESEERGLIATRGFTQLSLGYDGFWEVAAIRLQALVAGYLSGSVVVQTLDYLHEQVAVGTRSRSFWPSHPAALAPSEHVVRYARYLKVEEENGRFQDEKLRIQEESERQHRGNIDALRDRQRRILPVVADTAQQARGPHDIVYVGQPPLWWSPDHDPSPDGLISTPETASGLMVWLGQNAYKARPFAVVCPVARRCTWNLGAAWRTQGVQVVVNDEREARSVAAAVGWSPDELWVVPV